MNTYLGSKGYTISKSELSLSEQEKIRTDLTVKPKVPGAPVTNISFFAYRESPNKMYVPHYYGVTRFGLPAEVCVSDGDNINLEFVGSLREAQINVVNAYISHVSVLKYGGGLLELNCGGGKTVCGLNIISLLKKKTLIIVHKEFLMNQWIERITQFLPSAKIGKIQGNIVELTFEDSFSSSLPPYSLLALGLDDNKKEKDADSRGRQRPLCESARRGAFPVAGSRFEIPDSHEEVCRKARLCEAP